MDSFHIWHIWSLAWIGVLHVVTLYLDLHLQGYLAITVLQTVEILNILLYPSCNTYSYGLGSFHIWQKMSLAWGVLRVIILFNLEQYMKYTSVLNFFHAHQPSGNRRNDVKTTLRRYFDVIVTLLLHRVPIGKAWDITDEGIVRSIWF